MLLCGFQKEGVKKKVIHYTHCKLKDRQQEGAG
ncbi:hypothetical protein Nmel_018480 [Mimus melanotis]